MRFMIMAMANDETESGPPPSNDAFVAMQEYNEKAVKAGVLLAAEGLTPTSKGTRLKFEGAKCTVIDGPFTESKELIAGFCIIKVQSKEEAIAWVKAAPRFTGGVVEIRKLMDIEDFGEGFTPNEEIAKVKY